MKMWIARTRMGDIKISRSKFNWLEEMKVWYSNDLELRIYHKLKDVESEDLFPEVTFENSPQEVELKLIEK